MRARRVGKKWNHADGGVGQGEAFAVQTSQWVPAVEQGRWSFAFFRLIEGVGQLTKVQQQIAAALQRAARPRGQQAREGMGFVGREEGVAALAVATVER